MLKNIKHIIIGVSLIVSGALASELKDIKYDPKVYNCTLNEFQEALENVKDKMALVGLEG